MDWYRLFLPYWIQNHPTSMEWDAFLNSILDNIEYIDTSSHYTTIINEIKVWTSNWPYAYGSPYGIDVLPTVSTRKRLRKLIRDIKLNELIKKNS